jgi:hypothetical protein
MLSKTGDGRSFPAVPYGWTVHVGVGLWNVTARSRIIRNVIKGLDGTESFEKSVFAANRMDGIPLVLLDR